MCLLYRKIVSHIMYAVDDMLLRPMDLGLTC